MWEKYAQKSSIPFVAFVLPPLLWGSVYVFTCQEAGNLTKNVMSLHTSICSSIYLVNTTRPLDQENADQRAPGWCFFLRFYNVSVRERGGHASGIVLMEQL